MWREMFFRKKISSPDISIIRIVNTLIERLALQIFETYARDLIKEDESYIIYAIWGAKESGHLTEIQDSIHKKVDPEARAIYDSLRLGNISESQSIAINSLIRGFVIFKILFMVERLRNQLGHSKSPENETVQRVLHHIRTIGCD
jgi:hypothetical protein